MKEYWIMPEIKKYVRRVLTRSFCTYTFHASTGCICTDIKLNTFRKICCRAYCEKISDDVAVENKKSIKTISDEKSLKPIGKKKPQKAVSDNKCSWFMTPDMSVFDKA